VVSIGNLSVGGTGKTPVVMTLARLLIETGERPAILSRGYKRRRPADGVVVVSDGVSLRSDVEGAGDEPFMMARSVPQAVVLVSSQRYLAGRLAETQFGCTLHLLDDGFQHLGLVRDLDLLIVTDEDVVNPHTLPLGRLREPLSAAAAADAVLVSSDAARVSEQIATTLEVSQLFRFERAIDAPRLVPTPDARSGFQTSWHQNAEGGSLVRPGPVFAIAGIARPHRFFEDLQQTGWSLAGTRTFADHHQFSAREVADVARLAQASGAMAVVMTEKDMVRLVAIAGASRIPNPDPRIPFCWVPLRVTLEPAFAPWLRDGLARARLRGSQAGGGIPAIQ
jgi:tetraacyldisaccharide 4'-kinase